MTTLTNRDGKISYASNSITKFLGYHLDEFIGRSIYEFINPDDTLAKNRLLEIFELPGTSFNILQRMRRKNGTWIWCEGSVTNMLHEPGVNALVSNFRDISEKKKIEKQQEFDRNNLNALINNTTGMMWSVDRNFNLITSNQQFDDSIQHMIGNKIERGSNILASGFNPESLERFKRYYERAFAGESFTEIEYTDVPFGIWSEVSFYPILEGDKVIGTACHSGNITEKKKAEVALLSALNEKNTILESIGDGFFTVDKNWIVTYWNHQAEKMLHVSKNAIMGHNLWHIFSDSTDSEFYKKYNQALETNEVIHFEGYYPKLTKWYEVSVYPSELGLAVYFKNITDRKLSDIRLNELHENLVIQTKELAISNAELEQFAYVASHDLQEPLRMVTSFLTQLEKKYGNVIDEKGKTYIHFAVDGAKRMRQIILDLLEFSRVGRIEDKLEDVNLNEVVDEIQTLFRKEISDKKAVLHIDRLPVINSYNAPLRQVFQNLISNALKYSVKDQACKIDITVAELNDHWQFCVTDNGIGIAEEYFDKIFIIFQRLHTKEEFSGTGMGLAVTKKIIENLGGKIWIKSELNKGSTFYFTLLKAIQD